MCDFNATLAAARRAADDRRASTARLIASAWIVAEAIREVAEAANVSAISSTGQVDGDHFWVSVHPEDIRGYGCPPEDCSDEDSHRLAGVFAAERGARCSVEATRSEWVAFIGLADDLAQKLRQAAEEAAAETTAAADLAERLAKALGGEEKEGVAER
jgi:hypothetical protein